MENPIYAIIQLAQTTMRSELGKITLDKKFKERATLNEKIVVSYKNSKILVEKILLYLLYSFNYCTCMETVGFSALFW